ncbi:MAG: small ribosomal subunit Rsm22 family protein [Mycobacteriales bacterium]
MPAPSADVPAALRDALAAELAGHPRPQLAAATRRLIGRYRNGVGAGGPVLASAVDVAAYAAYRLPATHAAVRTALAQATRVAPALAPDTLLDVGGGAGAATWAAAVTFPTLTAATVLDQERAALDLGRRLAAAAPWRAVRDARWRQERFGARRPDLPAADLVTVSYLLGELEPARQAVLLDALAAAGRVVAVVEPGTPAGHRRVLAARDRLLAAGLSVLAPCPHQDACPLADGDDWCHFAARVSRTALHRQVKDATEGHEDEKFSFVVAARTPYGTAPGRVLRHPRQRKGLVTLEVCAAGGGVARELVSKRQGERYRRAREVGWGDEWPTPVDES